MRLSPLRLGLALAVVSSRAFAQESEIRFKTRVNLVSVPVVVRDSKGVPVGNLEKADFQLFDRGKPQAITRFTVEKAPPPASDATPKAETGSGRPPAVQLFPERFVAYLFDDVHLAFEELVWLRDAARRHMAGLANSDRAAIYSTSGQTMLDFTDDRDAWYATLQKLSPRPMTARDNLECPNLSYYQANQIANRNDTFAFQAAVTETMSCAHLDRQMRSVAEALANSVARRIVSQNEHEV